MKQCTVSGAVTVLLPAVAWGMGTSPPTDSFSLLSSLFQMGAALVLVLGLILLVYYGATRLMHRVPALRPGSRYIRVIEVRPLEPRKSLILVEVGGEYLLLASSDGNLSLVKQVAMLEEGDIIEDSNVKLPFATVFKRFKSGSGAPEPPPRTV
ncbi:flagellar biosynthetic protein FliO [Trichlorobacter ammonificans]|uniref:Flagellar protein n=1 Tax=Trichlorobacter ammonificans TaxID=2916410 RepID=A0ABM9D5L0_9BACT|nr:flagellar biosynthetic protein FliO [Trichlorobacter ammonificans]CAH2029999.1 Flagellar protein FliO/FliZ [Trichlorobacter ammonificans]